MAGIIYCPLREKCCRSCNECQVPPQVQPIAVKARTTGPSGVIIPGRTQFRSRYDDASSGSTTSPLWYGFWNGLTSTASP